MNRFNKAFHNAYLGARIAASIFMGSALSSFAPSTMRDNAAPNQIIESNYTPRNQTLENAVSLLDAHSLQSNPNQLKSTNLDGVIVQGYLFDKVMGGIPLENGKVVAVDHETHQRLDSTYSDVSGFVNFDFQVGKDELPGKSGDKIYPNPYFGTANLEINTKSSGYYNVSIVGVDGRIHLNKNLELREGYNSLRLSGGTVGLYMVNVFNETEKHTIKANRGQSDNAAFDVELSSVGRTESALKSTSSQDSLDFIITKDGYESKVLTRAVESFIDLENIDVFLNPTYTINTVFRPFDVNGNPANITVSITWPNVVGTDSTLFYFPDENNNINIQKKLWTPNARVTMELDSVLFANNLTYLGWLIGRDVHQKTYDTNIFQNPKQTFQLPEPVITNMNDTAINGKTIHLYVCPKYVHIDPWNGIDSLRMDSPPMREMMSSRAGPVTHKFVDLTPDAPDNMKPFYDFQPIFIVNVNNLNDTTNLVSEENLDRAQDLAMITRNLSTIPNTGDAIMTASIWRRITGFRDSAYIASMIRAPDGRGDQFTFTYFHYGDPLNDCGYKNTYTLNGGIRISKGNAKFSQSETDGVIFSEFYKLNTALADPWTTTGTTAGAFVWSEQNHTVSEAGATMLRFIYILNHNTRL